MDASRMGKNKMISQTVGLSFLLLSIVRIQFFLDAIGMIFIWISVILSYWSAGDYCLQFYRQAKHHDRQKD